MPLGNPDNVRVGAGRLLFGSVGAPEPASTDDTWDNNYWAYIGYTEEGHEASIEPSFEAMTVAEEPLPIRYDETSREMRLSFSSAELTAGNIAKALNGGTISAENVLATSIGSVTFTDTGDLVTVSVAHGLEVGDRVVFGTITTTTGVTAGTAYYVKTAPTTTTLTLSATDGGATLALTTDGSSVSIRQVIKIDYTFEPPAVGDVTYISIGWESTDGMEKWVFRKCIQVGGVAIARRKSTKGLIPMEFRVVTDPDGDAPFVAIIAELA